MTKIDNYYEYCDNGCSGGSCITCDDTLRPTGQYRCTGGYSQQYYTSECGGAEWRGSEDSPDGTGCCNIELSGGTRELPGCECTTYYEKPGVPSGKFCASTDSEALVKAMQWQMDETDKVMNSTPCNQMKTNAYVSATATKQGCPSNCTAPTASAYWSAGTVNVECGGDGSSRRCFESCDQAEATRMAQADADRLAQEKANAMECDCPESSWTATAVIRGNPCSGLSGTTSALRVNYEYSYDNPCGSSKSFTVTAYCGGSYWASKTQSVPSGSGNGTGTISSDYGCDCGTITVSGSGGGTC